MVNCSAFGCKNHSNKPKPGLGFHSFPQDAARRARWIRAIHRVGFHPTKYSRICTEHFHDKFVNRTYPSGPKLRENAVPTIFPGFPEHLQKLVKMEDEPLPTTSESEPTAVHKMKVELRVTEEELSTKSSPQAEDVEVTEAGNNSVNQESSAQGGTSDSGQRSIHGEMDDEITPREMEEGEEAQINEISIHEEMDDEETPREVDKEAVINEISIHDEMDDKETPREVDKEPLVNEISIHEEMDDEETPREVDKEALINEIAMKHVKDLFVQLEFDCAASKRLITDLQLKNKNLTWQLSEQKKKLEAKSREMKTLKRSIRRLNARVDKLKKEAALLKSKKIRPTNLENVKTANLLINTLLH